MKPDQTNPSSLGVRSCEDRPDVAWQNGEVDELGRPGYQIEDGVWALAGQGWAYTAEVPDSSGGTSSRSIDCYRMYQLQTRAKRISPSADMLRLFPVDAGVLQGAVINAEHRCGESSSIYSTKRSLI